MSINFGKKFFRISKLRIDLDHFSESESVQPQMENLVLEFSLTNFNNA